MYVILSSPTFSEQELSEHHKSIEFIKKISREVSQQLLSDEEAINKIIENIPIDHLRAFYGGSNDEFEEVCETDADDEDYTWDLVERAADKLEI